MQNNITLDLVNHRFYFGNQRWNSAARKSDPSLLESLDFSWKGIHSCLLDARTFSLLSISKCRFYSEEDGWIRQ
jgi:hypothetical protein